MLKKKFKKNSQILLKEFGNGVGIISVVLGGQAYMHRTKLVCSGIKLPLNNVTVGDELML